jgi:hypothetical protein
MTWIALKLKCSACNQENMLFFYQNATSPKCNKCSKIFPDIEFQSGNGFIYLLSNPCMPGLVKIGFTEKDVFERAKELGTVTGVPAPFIVEAYSPSRNPRSDEADIHQSFSERRISNSEFFKISVDEALERISEICGFSPVFLRDGLQIKNHDPQTDVPKRWLRCRTCNHEWSIPEELMPDPPCPKCSWPVSTRLRYIKEGG